MGRETHPITDRLVARSAGAQLPRECDYRTASATGACRGRLQPPEEWMGRDEEGGYAPFEIRTRRVAHVQIDGQLLRPATGQFYSQRSLEHGEVFESRMWAGGGSEEVLRSVVGAGCGVAIGRGKSRGQGRVELTLGNDVPVYPSAAERLSKLNQTAGLFTKLRGYTVFAVTFVSHAIVLDEWLMSRSWLSAGDVGLTDYSLLGWFSEFTRISGWHAAARLPKAEVAGIAAGSCFLFGKRCGVEGEQERLLEAGERIENLGIGERLEEGFGEAVFCHPFHATHGEPR